MPAPGNCPACKAPLETPLGCKACGVLLSVPDDASPFALFGLNSAATTAPAALVCPTSLICVAEAAAPMEALYTSTVPAPKTESQAVESSSS